jgi:hypothetical protein
MTECQNCAKWRRWYELQQWFDTHYSSLRDMPFDPPDDLRSAIDENAQLRKDLGLTD